MVVVVHRMVIKKTFSSFEKKKNIQKEHKLSLEWSFHNKFSVSYFHILDSYSVELQFVCKESEKRLSPSLVSIIFVILNCCYISTEIDCRVMNFHLKRRFRFSLKRDELSKRGSV